jgi:Na+-transporting methylmalonyl-CoA/oxaloacetate decarboxylase gamma subunit
MIFQNINSDSLKVAKDSLAAAVQQDEVMNKVSFNISNLSSADVILTVLGYSIVFLALLLLFVTLINVSKLLKLNLRKRLMKAGKHSAEHEELSISGETIAAISTGILLHFQEAHDFENTVITIKKVQSVYSPWNSKLYGLRQTPKY